MKKLFALVAVAGLSLSMIGCENKPAPSPPVTPAPGTSDADKKPDTTPPADTKPADEGKPAETKP
jgi:hypothetical protein